MTSQCKNPQPPSPQVPGSPPIWVPSLPSPTYQVLRQSGGPLMGPKWWIQEPLDSGSLISLNAPYSGAINGMIYVHAPLNAAWIEDPLGENADALGYTRLNVGPLKVYILPPWPGDWPATPPDPGALLCTIPVLQYGITYPTGFFTWITDWFVIEMPGPAHYELLQPPDPPLDYWTSGHLVKVHTIP